MASLMEGEEMARKISGVFAVVMLLAGMLSAQGSPAPQGRGRAGADMTAHCQQMMADMQATQKKLDDLVASMNAAKGEEKIDRVAAVVTEMVAQHRQMMGAMPMTAMPHHPENK
jgi:hypothetical protein